MYILGVLPAQVPNENCSRFMRKLIKITAILLLIEHTPTEGAKN